VLNEPVLCEAVGEFMALSWWRVKGGYEEARRLVQAKVVEWEAKAPPLSRMEVVRRKVLVCEFLVKCGQCGSAIAMLEGVIAEADMEDSGSPTEVEIEGVKWHHPRLALPLVEEARLHYTLGQAYDDLFFLGGKDRYSNAIKSAAAFERSVGLCRVVDDNARDEHDFAAALRGTFSISSNIVGIFNLSRWLGIANAALAEIEGLATEAQQEALAQPRSSIYVYRKHPDYRGPSSTGPQHGPAGDRVIEEYETQLEEIERNSTQDTTVNCANDLQRFFDTLYNLYVVYQDREQIEKSAQCLQRALGTYETMYGPHHPRSQYYKKRLAKHLRDRLDMPDEAVAVEEGFDVLVTIVSGVEKTPESTSSGCIERAAVLLGEAIAKDDACEYIHAYGLYQKALRCFEVAAECERNSVCRAMITRHAKRYVERAQELNEILLQAGVAKHYRGSEEPVIAVVTIVGDGGRGSISSKSQLRVSSACVKKAMSFVAEAIDIAAKANAASSTCEYWELLPKAHEQYQKSLHFLRLAARYESNSVCREAISRNASLYAQHELRLNIQYAKHRALRAATQ
jgi:tetratricopeptide (TPR) repeat protein